MHHAIMIFLGILIIAAIGVGIAIKTKKEPSIVLVIMGLIVGIIGKFTETELLDEVLHFATNDEFFYHIVVSIFLAILLGQAVLHITIDELKQSIRPIGALSVVGTMLTFILIAVSSYYLLGLGLIVSFVFASVMSPTDPISVLNMLKSANVNKRLSIIIEGESLFNDGVSLVLFKLSAFSLAILMSMGATGVGLGLWEFVKVIGGGLILAFAFGKFFAWVTSKFNHPAYETLLLVIMFMGGFFVAEELHVSGVITVVASGLVFGIYKKKSMSSGTQLAVETSFNFFNLVAISLIFFLVGLEVSVMDFSNKWDEIILAILIVTIMRSISVYTSLAPIKNFPTSWKHLINWGGLKGSLSVALVLSLPHSFEGREDLLVLTFSVVIFSLIVQGLTIKPLIKKLGLSQDEGIIHEYQDIIIQLASAESSVKTLNELYTEGKLQKSIYNQLKVEKETLIAKLEKEEEKLMKKHPQLKEKQINDAMQIMRENELLIIKELLHEGIIDDKSAEKHKAHILNEIIKHSNH